MKGRQEKEVLIIIPAYNEEKTIPGLLEKLEEPGIREIADVLVMNDASSDNTNWIVKGRHHTLVTHVFNLGYGSALQLGYKYAIRRDYKYVIQMDADGQHDPCNIPKIYQVLIERDEKGDRPDIVLASRFLEGSGRFSVSGLKKLAFWFFRTLIHFLTGRVISDPTTGLQGLSRRAVLYYSQYNHFDDRYPDANMILQMLLLEFRIREIPAVMHKRTAGVSMHHGLRPVLYMFRMFFSILAVYARIKIFKIESKDKIPNDIYMEEDL